MVFHHENGRAAAQEGVARPLFAALYGLEQKRVRPGPEPEVGGQWRIQVRRELGEHRHEVALVCEPTKLVSRGRQRWDFYARGSDAQLGSGALDAQRGQLFL